MNPMDEAEAELGCEPGELAGTFPPSIRNLTTFPTCSEGDHVNDDNPGASMCRTCADWVVTG